MAGGRRQRETRQVNEGRTSSADTRRAMRDIGHLSGYGLGWAMTVALLAWVGIRLDAWLGTSPLMVLLGTLGGIAAGMVTVYMRTMVRPPARPETDASGRGEAHR